VAQGRDVQNDISIVLSMMDEKQQKHLQKHLQQTGGRSDRC